jgi:uncharacterized protein
LILVDANLLIYAAVTDMSQHDKARNWLESALNRSPRVGLPWPSLLAFIRIVTNHRLFPQPWGIEDAWRQVVDWCQAPCAWHPQATSSHTAILEKYLLEVRGGNSVPDAHLAALATEHGLVLQSADQGFARFSGLRWENPLTEI